MNNLSKGTVITIIVVALLLSAPALLLGTITGLIVDLSIVVVLILLGLFVAKTKAGRRVGEVVGRRLFRTRLGNRMSRSMIRNQAKRQGVALTDPAGRRLSDVELQLQLVDTPETRQIKQQLKRMNPQQRAQALRLMEAQMLAAQRGEVSPDLQSAARTSPAFQPPRASGRPTTRAPRSKSRKGRR